MSREQLLELDARRAHRPTQPLELRAATGADDGALNLVGYAATTNVWYEMYGGPPYGWDELINQGAFGKTLSEKPKVDLLINPDDMPLASTVAKRYILTLTEDQMGLYTDALMNPTEADVQLLASKMEDLRMREMSFAFRIIRQQWEDENGDLADSMTAPRRRILEISLDKGDVSVVNNGANDTTWSTLRALEEALAEMRDGHELNEEQRALVRGYLATDPPPRVPAPVVVETSLSPADVRAYIAAGRPIPQVA